MSHDPSRYLEAALAACRCAGAIHRAAGELVLGVVHAILGF